MPPYCRGLPPANQAQGDKRLRSSSGKGVRAVRDPAVRHLLRLALQVFLPHLLRRVAPRGQAGATQCRAMMRNPPYQSQVNRNRLCPKFPMNSSRNTATADRGRELEDAGRSPTPGTARRTCRTRPQVRPEAGQDGEERQRPRACPSRRRAGRTGCATRSCCRWPAATPRGRRPVSGLAAHSWSPVIRPSIRPSPDSLRVRRADLRVDDRLEPRLQRLRQRHERERGRDREQPRARASGGACRRS